MCWDRYGSIPLLAVWVVAMQFVQASSYNYLGALSAFTAIVVVFGHRLTASGASLTAERYTLAREEEIVCHPPLLTPLVSSTRQRRSSKSIPAVCVQVIGVVIALMISSVLWPVSSIRLIRSEVMLSLGSFQVGLDNTLSVYESLGKKYVRWKESKDRSPEMERVGEIEEKQTQPQQLQQLVLDVAKNEGEQKVNGAGAVNAKAETHHISAVEEEDECTTHCTQRISASLSSIPCAVLTPSSPPLSLFGVSVERAAVRVFQCADEPVAAGAAAG